MRIRTTLIATLLAFTAIAAQAQFSGTTPPDLFKDRSMLKPPAGSKVAIIVFEDLGCPGCAHAHPIEQQVADKYHVPLIRYDFPIAGHIWTFDGAVCARYLEDTLKNPHLAEQYRTAVFAVQASIASKDDLHSFTQKWMSQHGQSMPFVMDPGGQLAAKVKADYDLGIRLGLHQTPTIVVASQNKYQVVCGIPPERGGKNDPIDLYPVVEAALAQTKAATPAPAAHKHS